MENIRGWAVTLVDKDGTPMFDSDEEAEEAMKIAREIFNEVMDEIERPDE